MGKPKPSQYEKEITTKDGLSIYCKTAKHISYGSTRDKSTVKYIVIHYTGNSGDTAWGNANFFSPDGSNARSAGAHFFVDKDGITFRSIPMNKTAYSVGGVYSKYDGGGKYYKKCLNSNSVSIELCNYTRNYPSEAQMNSVIKLVKYIQTYCPNAKTIIRHFDVNYKTCPYPMIGKNNKHWKQFKKELKANGIKASFA